MIKLICYIVPVSYIFELSRHNYWQLVHNLLWMYNLTTISGFVLDQKLQRNASKYLLYHQYKNNRIGFFVFLFFAKLYLLQWCYINIDLGIHYNKSNLAQNVQQKQQSWFSYPKKYGKYEASLWSFLSSSKTPKIVRSATKQNIYDLYVIQKQILLICYSFNQHLIYKSTKLRCIFLPF